MGTRSTVGFRSGNEVRYIYVASDGFKHGATLEKIGHDACLKLWEQIGEAEKAGKKLWLDHLYTDGVLPIDWALVQPNARTPIVATEQNWSKEHLETQGFQLSGIVKVETNWKNKVSPFDLMHLIDMEGTVWLYDLDNDKVFFMGDQEAAEGLVYNHKPTSSTGIVKKQIEF